jgi:hypothetical protein
LKNQTNKQKQRQVERNATVQKYLPAKRNEQNKAEPILEKIMGSIQK